MNPILEFDASGLPITPDLILANKDGSYIGIITNVSNFSDGYYMNSPNEISFTVTKTIDGKDCWVWDDIKDFKMIYAPQHAEWYEISINISESTETVKSVNGIHAQEAELSQRLVFETEINTEDDIARDDYVVTKFYDPTNAKGSLLHRLLSDKCQDYSIYHVDNSLREIQRMFSFDKRSVKDCLDDIAQEVECLFVYGESLDDDGKLHRTISAYDLLDYCLDCGKRGTYTNGVCTECGSTNIKKGYGAETNIFVSKENIASSITLKTNSDKVKNCFRLEAGDDVMTAVIRSINPNGSQYIWYFSDDMRSDMSDGLRMRLAQYDDLYDHYRNEHNMDLVPQSMVTNYNTLVTKYKPYVPELSSIDYPIIGTTNLVAADYKARYMYDVLKTTMMPGSSEVEDTTAQEQVANLTVGNLSPIGVGPDKKLENVSLSTADAAVVNYAKLWVDTSRYRVQVVGSSFTNPTWRGTIVVTSFTKDEDTASTPVLSLTFNVAEATYIKQSIEKAINKMETQNLGAVALFNLSNSDFRAELPKYSYSYLGILRDVCRACLDIMIEQGISEREQDLYTQLYQPYFIKSGYIEQELKTREAELAIVLAPTKEASPGLIDRIEKQRVAVAEALDMPTYLGDELWQELMSFRRDDTYQNNNYISDGLNDAELIENAQDFYEAAMKEVRKSAELQSTLSGKLQNFLVMPEFQDIASHIKLGNKIYLEIDGKVYQLRLISYEIDYSRVDNIDIAFSDVIKAGDLASDIKSILDQAQSVASSYNATIHQANKGSRADAMLNNWVLNGLDLTAKKIVNTADNQNMVLDETGMYMRRSLDFEDGFSPEQVKIINSGLYYTTDAWETVKAGVGRFKYIHPETGNEITDFGVIANTVMGDLIIGNKLNIYNSNGSLKMDANGTIFTLRNNADNSSVFKIRKDNGDNTYTNLMSINASNQIVLNGSEVNLTGYVTMSNLSTAGQTTINGANITTGTITLGGTNGSLLVKNADGNQIGKWDKNGISVTSGSLDIGNGVFKVTTAGALTATSATITGKISATSGTIGASNATNKITIGTNATNASIYSGMSSLGNTSSNGFYIGTDGIALGAGKFKVTAAGALTATSATLTGAINATSGTIGANATNKITIGTNATNASIYSGMTSLADTTHDGFYIGADGIALGKGKFKVTKAGVLSASNVDLTGNLHSTDGTTYTYVSNGGFTVGRNATGMDMSIYPSGAVGRVVFNCKTAVFYGDLTSRNGASATAVYLGGNSSFSSYYKFVLMGGLLYPAS